MGAPGRVAVVHIAYAPFGVEPFGRFVESYRRHDAGAPHELVVAFKGFDGEAATAGHRALLAGVAHRAVSVPDGGFDLGTYRIVAAALDHELCCFLNSNSELRADGWLAKLRAALDGPGVLAAGATGSFQSLSSDVLRGVGMGPGFRSLRLLKRRLVHLALMRFHPGFPNPHLRTNGFLIRRADFLSLRMRPMRTKRDAMRFESGWRGMTRQLLARGGGVRLVDAGGLGLDVARWPDGAAFWRGGQEALLVADNQTGRYDAADAAEREVLTRYAWVPPRPPGDASSA